MRALNGFKCPGLLVFVSMLGLAVGCDDDEVDPTSDMSTVLDMSAQDMTDRLDMPGVADMAGGDSSGDDQGEARDMAPDLSPPLCDTVIEVGADAELLFLDDVSVFYEVSTSPAVDTDYTSLTFLFERYSPLPDVGEFELGQGADENFGNCAHCLYMRGPTPELAYFANGGTLITSKDPYGRQLDVNVKNLTLIPVAVDPLTRESTPIADGKCVQVKDFTIDRSFTASGWTCEDARYNDGENCDCECGVPDPDCNGPSCLPGDQACLDGYTPLPVVGCEANEQCAFNPEMMDTVCQAECDWKARTSCNAGACLFSQRNAEEMEPDQCVVSTQRFVNKVVGERCVDEGELNNLQLYCAVDAEGFAMGYCDAIDVCRAVCEQDSECTDPDHTCRRFVGETSLGYCGPAPPEDG